MELRTLRQSFESAVMERVLAVHVSTHANKIDRGKSEPWFLSKAKGESQKSRGYRESRA